MPVLVDVVRRALSHEGPAFLIGKRDSGAADQGNPCLIHGSRHTRLLIYRLLSPWLG